MALLTGFGILFVVLGCALVDNWWPLMSRMAAFNFFLEDAIKVDFDGS